VRRQRRDLGFALQLCALRYLGFCPDDLVTAPPAAISFVADQLQVIPAVLRAYGARPQTRTGHSQQIQRYLRFHDATREDLRSLANWLLARALEHDKPSLLFQLAREHLLAEKIVRPGVALLERLVMAAREGGQTPRRNHRWPVYVLTEIDSRSIGFRQTTPRLWLVNARLELPHRFHKRCTRDLLRHNFPTGILEGDTSRAKPRRGRQPLRPSSYHRVPSKTSSIIASPRGVQGAPPINRIFD
jgi:hypothetical protein